MRSRSIINKQTAATEITGVYYRNADHKVLLLATLLPPLLLPLEEEEFHRTARGRGGEGRGAERRAHSPQEVCNLQELQYYEV